MSDALARYRMAERQDKDALKRYKDSGAESNTLGALAKYLGLQGYWDRQGRQAQQGLQMADQGAQAVQAGNMGGLAGMILGPAAYIGSPVSALFPERSEVEAATDVPEWSKPLIAGGLETMAIMAPGPKTRGLGRGMASLADDATDAERAALAGRLNTEAAQTGGTASSVGRDQALGNLVNQQGKLPPQAMTADGVHTGWVMRDVDRGGMNYPAVSQPQMRAINRAIDTQDWVKAEVPIRGMYATQNHVNPDFASAAARRSDELPLAVRVNGKIYLRDGHHRVVSAANDGKQTAKVRLIDVDGMAEGGASQQDLFDTLKRYAIPFTIGTGGAVIVSGQNMPPDLAAQMGPQG